MTTDRILTAIDEEIARLKKVRDLLSTSTAAAKDNTASPVRKRRKLSAVCPEGDCRGTAETVGQTEEKGFREVRQVCALRNPPQASDLISSSFQVRRRIIGLGLVRKLSDLIPDV